MSFTGKEIRVLDRAAGVKIETGRIETYTAETVTEAVRTCIFLHRGEQVTGLVVQTDTDLFIDFR
jgi:hypothetical protein